MELNSAACSDSELDRHALTQTAVGGVKLEFTIQTNKERQLVDITERVAKALPPGASGVCIVYLPHATAGLIINEFEPNIEADILAHFEKLFPNGNYMHNRIDDNAQAHLASAFIGCSQVIPFSAGRLQLGTWQRLLLCEFGGPRERRVIVKVMKE